MQNDKPVSREFRDPRQSAETTRVGAAVELPRQPGDVASGPSPLAPHPSPFLFLRAVGSLRLALALIALYIAALVWGTAVEKLSGAAAAWSAVYGAWWFVALNAILAVNIISAVFIRFPWPRRRMGFVVTHLGIAVLSIGCLLSWRGGSKALLPVVEGRAAHLAYDETRPDSPPDELGFQVYLHKFRRKLDPGAATAAHYSSLVDFLDRADPPNVLRGNVLISLNEPVDFTDPRSGRTYRLFQSSFDGPWTPGDPQFDRYTEGRRDRGHVYRSVLSVNRDPGRWWKYAGSLSIVLGIVLTYYVRFKPANKNSRRLTAAGDKARNSVNSRGLSSLVFLSFIPLVLFAGIISTAAGANEPRRLDWSEWRLLPVFGEGRVEPLDTFARETVAEICGRAEPALDSGPDGRRTFAAPELLFAWLAEPEKWERVPFLPAGDEWLRRDVLNLPLRGEDGRPLRFVSPAEVEQNAGLDKYLIEFQRRVETEGKYFRPSANDSKVQRLVGAYGRYRRLTFDAESLKDTPRRFYARVGTVGEVWHRLIADRQGARRIAKDVQVRELMVEINQKWQALIAKLHKKEFSRKEIEPAAVAYRLSCEKLAERLDDGNDVPLKGLAAELRRQVLEMHLALYDNGDALRLVPSLDPGALEENRLPTDDASPWLSFQALIRGGDEALRGYPRPELDAARKAFDDARAAYRDRGAADGPARFAAAMRRFAVALRALTDKIEPLRRQLPLPHRDETLLAATAYPPPGSTDAEVLYNRLDPFFWSWIAGIAAVIFLLSGAGRFRRPAFWLGAAALALSLGFSLAGLGLRTYITGLVPLTGMFESVVVVATFVFILGLWLALLPLFRWSAVDNDSSIENNSRGLTAPGGKAYDSSTFRGPLASGYCGARTRMESVLERRLFALSGAIVGTLALVLAYYAPATVMHRNIGAAAPILRDNFWLVVHVVTIMAGYASAAIALILGNVALGYYLFGRYRDCGESGRRPPPACAALAGFIYTAVKITVLLLTAGSILGALWADKSWGRFWGWDPKEVWALVSLLVYLWFLHARHIRWSGDFGLAATAILGATVILFNWYGVNFILAIGLHAYASGAGGQLQVSAAVGAQLLFLLAATVRYLNEKSQLDLGLGD